MDDSATNTPGNITTTMGNRVTNATNDDAGSIYSKTHTP